MTGVAVAACAVRSQAGVRLEIDKQATLGRSSDAELQLVDGKVSRQHCRFTIAAAGWRSRTWAATTARTSTARS
jgi:pSer/pThr/pTyr-binding forkhead associated (FHA) protein